MKYLTTCVTIVSTPGIGAQACSASDHQPSTVSRNDASRARELVEQTARGATQTE